MIREQCPTEFVALAPFLPFILINEERAGAGAGGRFADPYRDRSQLETDITKLGRLSIDGIVFDFRDSSVEGSRGHKRRLSTCHWWIIGALALSETHFCTDKQLMAAIGTPPHVEINDAIRRHKVEIRRAYGVDLQKVPGRGLRLPTAPKSLLTESSRTSRPSHETAARRTGTRKETAPDTTGGEK